jgi:hypothetical protein
MFVREAPASSVFGPFELVDANGQVLARGPLDHVERMKNPEIRDDFNETPFRLREGVSI